MSKTMSNKFKTTVSVSLPKQSSQKLCRYINFLRTGKETLTEGQKVTKAHEKAHHNLHHVREVELEFSVDKDGNWTFIGINKNLS